jgi:hypothetical protein
MISTGTLYSATGITPTKKPIDKPIALFKLKLWDAPIISFLPHILVFYPLNDIVCIGAIQVCCCTIGKLHSDQAFDYCIQKFNVHAVIGLDSNDDKVVLNVDEYVLFIL